MSASAFALAYRSTRALVDGDRRLGGTPNLWPTREAAEADLASLAEAGEATDDLQVVELRTPQGA